MALRCIQAGLQSPAGNLQDLWEQGPNGKKREGRGTWTLRCLLEVSSASLSCLAELGGHWKLILWRTSAQGPQMTCAQPIKGMDKGKGKD